MFKHGITTRLVLMVSLLVGLVVASDALSVGADGSRDIVRNPDLTINPFDGELTLDPNQPKDSPTFFECNRDTCKCFGVDDCYDLGETGLCDKAKKPNCNKLNDTCTCDRAPKPLVE